MWISVIGRVLTYLSCIVKFYNVGGNVSGFPDVRLQGFTGKVLPRTKNLQYFWGSVRAWMSFHTEKKGFLYWRRPQAPLFWTKLRIKK